MLGLIKKDLLLIKSNIKLLLMIFTIYIITALEGELNLSIILPIIAIMLFISTFSYDEFNNWNSYVVTLPNGRKNAVRAKYISSIIIILITLGISLGASIFINYYKNNTINIIDILSSLSASLLSIVIIVSFMYPIIFKVGSTSGRIWMFIIVFIAVIIIEFISKFINIPDITNTLNIVEKYSYILIPIISIVLLVISYLISNKIYQKKEF